MEKEIPTLLGNYYNEQNPEEKIIDPELELPTVPGDL